MTVKECYEAAVAFLPEKPEENPEMQKFMLNWCNMLLAENFNYENFLREVKGKARLENTPVLNDGEQEIPYDENFVRAVFPLGMARWCFKESGDYSAEIQYHNLYSTAIIENLPVLMTEVKDEFR